MTTQPDTYTIPVFATPLKANSTIQTIIDVDLLATEAKNYVTAVRSTLPTTEQNMLTWTNLPLSIWLDQLIMNFYLPSLGTQTPAPETKRSSTLVQRVAEMEKLSNLFPKCRFMLWGRSSPSAAWNWLGQDVIQNLGNRVNYLNILNPYLVQNNGDILGKTTQIGIQFVEEVLTKTTLPQAQDLITIKGGLRIELPELKKNDELLANIKLILNKLGDGTMMMNLNPGLPVNVSEGVRGAQNVTTAAVGVTVFPLLAANPDRASYNLYNIGTQTVYVREGATVSPTLYDIAIPPGYLWKETFSGSPRYLGAISAITASGVSSVQVSEGELL
jgi:hypothetical protein